MEFDIPVGGFNNGANSEQQPQGTTEDIMNMRAIGSLMNKLRLCQRPGMIKAKDEQIASVASPIVILKRISVVDYLGTS